MTINGAEAFWTLLCARVRQHAWSVHPSMTGVIQLELGAHFCHLVIRAGLVECREGIAAHPDARVRSSDAALAAWVRGARLQAGDLKVLGNIDLVKDFLTHLDGDRVFRSALELRLGGAA
jgi:hypothetical protein